MLSALGLHAEPAPRERVVVLGDSLTAGYGLPPAQAYPALLQRKADAAGWSVNVVNAGVSGDTTGDGLRRVDRVVTPETTVLIVALGANDGLRRLPPAEIARNLGALIDRARKRAPGVRIILAGLRMPPQLGVDYARAFEAIFPRVARERDVILLPHLLDRVGGVASLNLEDTIHPNAAGQRLIAETVWTGLEPVLRRPPAGAP